jgi:hypothetical protein
MRPILAFFLCAFLHPGVAQAITVDFSLANFVDRGGAAGLDSYTEDDLVVELIDVTHAIDANSPVVDRWRWRAHNHGGTEGFHHSPTLITFSGGTFDLVSILVVENEVVAGSSDLVFEADGGAILSTRNSGLIDFSVLPEFQNISFLRITTPAHATFGGNVSIDNINFAVPEPSTALLLALGLMGLAATHARPS